MLDTTDLCGILEDFLIDAKRGNLHHITVSAVLANGTTRGGFVGLIGKDAAALEALQSTQRELQTRIDDWTLPEQDPALGDGYACWHCGHGPAGFDFVVWLVRHEMQRVHAGAPAPLKVAFWLGRNPPAMRWVDNVYRPALAFVGAIEDVTAFKHIGHPYFATKPIVDLFNAGVKVPVFKPARQWDLPRRVITITLREASYYPDRNSNVGAWLTFARKLKDAGERVVFVRDTAKADEALPEFETCPVASKDLDARMWLYDNAKLNCFVANGPWSLAQFSNKPLLCFIPPGDEKSSYVPVRPSFWTDKMGISHGEQYPWHTPQQRIVWSRDSFEAIMAAWTKLNLTSSAPAA